MAAISLTKLYNEVFGIQPKYLIPRRGSMDMVDNRYEQTIPSFEISEAAENYSDLGTPILDVLLIHAGSYGAFEVVDGVPQRKDVIYAPYRFELWPMIDVSQNKVIVTTPINGRDGTVKEYIYTDDFNITIRGLLVGEGNNYPHDQRRELYSLFKLNTSLGVTSRVLNDLGIYSLVFKSIQFQDLEGYNNACQYTITALNDQVYELKIKE